MRPTDTCLPWPRTADDGTPLGINLAHRMVRADGAPPRPDPDARDGQTAADALQAIVAGYVANRRSVRRSLERAGLPSEDLAQMVALAVTSKNRQACAWDPRRASFSKYVTLVTRSTVANIRADIDMEPAAHLTARGDLPEPAACSPPDPAAVIEAVRAIGPIDKLVPVETHGQEALASFGGRADQLKIQRDLFGPGFTVYGPGFTVRFGLPVEQAEKVKPSSRTRHVDEEAPPESTDRPKAQMDLWGVAA